MSSDNHHLQSTAVGGFGGRVGHKAGGFISKKFFHPTNYKNQEKLWAAIEEKKEREKRQQELMKKREEERRVEQLKLEMSGASAVGSLSAGLNVSSGGGLFQSTNAMDERNAADSPESRSVTETKRRLELLRGLDSTRHISRISIKSRYDEDVHLNGHSAVWGSHFDMTNKCWGYACCRALDKSARCSKSSIKKVKALFPNQPYCDQT
jgi:hypothetical protein